MKLSSNENNTLWYVKDDENNIVFVSMFEEACMDYINKKGVRKV